MATVAGARPTQARAARFKALLTFIVACSRSVEAARRSTLGQVIELRVDEQNDCSVCIVQLLQLLLYL